MTWQFSSEHNPNGIVGPVTCVHMRLSCLDVGTYSAKPQKPASAFNKTDELIGRHLGCSHKAFWISGKGYGFGPGQKLAAL